MISYHTPNPTQRTIAQFDWPFPAAFDQNNRWVELSRCIPWDALAAGYNRRLSSNRGRPAKDARLVIAAVVIKHKLCLSDRETVNQIQENPYLQYFAGLAGYQIVAPFAPSLLVEVRKRMGDEVFEVFHQAIIDAVEETKRTKPTTAVAGPKDQDGSGDGKGKGKGSNDDQPPQLSEAAAEEKETTHQGRLIIDATVVGQAIRYPTDVSLLNEAREFTEMIIDKLYRHSGLQKKPRTYRQQARKAFLGLVKQRRPGGKARRRGIKQQLQYIRRNLGHIEQLMDLWPIGTQLPLPRWLLYRYWVIPHLYRQQLEMYQNKTRRCDDRIVSISQPYVRPMVRGKQDKPVEFGAKLSVSLTAQGISRVDHLSWDAFYEGHDLTGQVERYYDRYGYYPHSVVADPIYGTRDNRNYLKGKGIRFSGKPLGRPKKVTAENQQELKRLQAQRREDYLQRIPIEGKFGQGKNGYRLNYIRAKRADTAVAWINSIFLVMNLLILLRIFFVSIMKSVWGLIRRIRQWKLRLAGHWLGQRFRVAEYGRLQPVL
jgi:IS5 family transposase